jgi:hypothetical protein
MGSANVEELLKLIRTGLSNDELFPKINLAACHPVTSLSQLQRSAPMQTLSGLFKDAQLDPRVGYNQGTGDLSITVIMPKAAQFAHDSRYFCPVANCGHSKPI